MQMTISKWLRLRDSHDIYDADVMANLFEKVCGEPAPWKGSGHSPEEVRAAIRERGLGGTLSEDPPARLISGYEMAEDLARLKAAHGAWEVMNGRGTRFWGCIDALEKAGF